MRNARPCGASFAATCDGREEEHEVGLERVQHQRGGDGRAPRRRRRSRRNDDGAASFGASTGDRRRGILGSGEPRFLERRLAPAMRSARSRRRRRAPSRRTRPRRRSHSRPSRRIRSSLACLHLRQRRATHAAPRSRSRMIARTRTSDDGDRVEPRGERHDQHAGQHDRRHRRRRGQADRRALVQRVPPLAPRSR